MASRRITIRIPAELERELQQHANREGAAESEIVRDALQSYFQNKARERSAYEVAAELGLIGCAPGLPRDLSTNRKYFRGLGKKR